MPLDDGSSEIPQPPPKETGGASQQPQPDIEPIQPPPQSEAQNPETKPLAGEASYQHLESITDLQTNTGTQPTERQSEDLQRFQEKAAQTVGQSFQEGHPRDMIKGHYTDFIPFPSGEIPSDLAKKIFLGLLSAESRAKEDSPESDQLRKIAEEIFYHRNETPTTMDASNENPLQPLLDGLDTIPVKEGHTPDPAVLKSAIRTFLTAYSGYDFTREIPLKVLQSLKSFNLGQSLADELQRQPQYDLGPTEKHQSAGSIKSELPSQYQEDIKTQHVNPPSTEPSSHSTE